jgi:hypothetical protein
MADLAFCATSTALKYPGEGVRHSPIKAMAGLVIKFRFGVWFGGSREESAHGLSGRAVQKAQLAAP